MLGLQSTATISECPAGMQKNADGNCTKQTKPVAVLKTGNRDQYINIDPKDIPGNEYTGNKNRNLTVAIQKSLAKINSRLNNIQKVKEDTSNIGDKMDTLVPNSSGSNSNSENSNNSKNLQWHPTPPHPRQGHPLSLSHPLTKNSSKKSKNSSKSKNSNKSKNSKNSNKSNNSNNSNKSNNSNNSNKSNNSKNSNNSNNSNNSENQKGGTRRRNYRLLRMKKRKQTLRRRRT